MSFLRRIFAINRVNFSYRMDKFPYFSMIFPSYSREPFVTGDYADGEIYPLDEASELGQAILRERWLNVTTAEQADWRALLRVPTVRFVGTVISSRRQQVELTVCFQQPHPVYGLYASISITLARFQRFL